MTPLSDALTAAQRSALAALEKAYVAEQIDKVQLTICFSKIGITDIVDGNFLVASLDVLREWGVSAPTMTERVAAEQQQMMTTKQYDYIVKLAEEKGLEPPNKPLTRNEASEVIEQIKAGSYDAKQWTVPF